MDLIRKHIKSASSSSTSSNASSTGRPSRLNLSSTFSKSFKVDPNAPPTPTVDLRMVQEKYGNYGKYEQKSGMGGIECRDGKGLPSPPGSPISTIHITGTSTQQYLDHTNTKPSAHRSSQGKYSTDGFKSSYEQDDGLGSSMYPNLEPQAATAYLHTPQASVSTTHSTSEQSHLSHTHNHSPDSHSHSHHSHTQAQRENNTHSRSLREAQNRNPSQISTGVENMDASIGSLTDSHLPDTSLKPHKLPSAAQLENTAKIVGEDEVRTIQRYRIHDFTFRRTLGTGSFGRVHLVISNHNHRPYAVKVLNKEKVVRMKQVEHTNSEREMLGKVRNPFLVNLWGTFRDSERLYMIMDFVSGGELFSLLRKSHKFPDSVAKFYAAEVALGLNYLHSKDIIYRDLKPENILLGADGHIKITDFGFAKYVPDVTFTLCGTPDYLAPEIVQSRAYNKSVDWYAFGVLVFEMLAGYPPFFTDDTNPMRLYEKIIANKVRYPSHISSTAKHLLKNLLIGDVSKRYGNLVNGTSDIFGHPWFAEVDWDRLYGKEIRAPYCPRTDGDDDDSHFDRYQEVDISEYGREDLLDPHGYLFKDF